MSSGIMWQVSDRSEHLCPLYILPHLSPKQIFIHKDDQATLYPWSRESCWTRGLKSYWVCRAEGPTELRRIPSSVNISGPLMTHRQPRLPHVTFTFLGLFPEWAVLPTPPLKIISHHKKKKKILKAMVQAALLTIKRKDHIIAVINHWLRFIIAIIPSKFIVTAVNDQFIRALTILGNGLSRLMWVTTNFSRIIA